MMRLEHVNIVVKNMEASLKFYQAAFPNWIVRMQGKNNWYGIDRQWGHFGDDYNYITFNDNGQGEARDLQSNNIGLAHFGFEVVDLAALEFRLKNAGFEYSLKGPEHEFRSNTYFIDPNGIEVEFVQYSSEIPQQRNSA